MLNIEIELAKSDNVEVGDYIMTPYETLFRVVEITVGNQECYTLISVKTGKSLRSIYESIEDLLYKQLEKDDKIIKAEDLKITNR